MPNNSEIKFIIFDLSEVLLTGIKATGEALTEQHGLHETFDHNVGWTNIQTPLLVPQVEDFFHGHVSEDEYVTAVLDRYPQLGDSRWLKSHIRENFREVEGTREIIHHLKDLGYTLALLSIHSKEWVEYCEDKFKFQSLFSSCMYSYETKVSKPDPRSFHFVLEKLGAKAHECLFIDDAQKNIVAAEALGIKSFLFVDAKDLEIKLKEFLPNF